jgi:hypothetical protein
MAEVQVSQELAQVEYAIRMSGAVASQVLVQVEYYDTKKCLIDVPNSDLGVEGKAPSFYSDSMIAFVPFSVLAIFAPNPKFDYIVPPAVIPISSPAPEIKIFLSKHEDILSGYLGIIDKKDIKYAYVNFTEIFNILTPLGVTLGQLINTPIAQLEIQSIINQLSSYISNFQSVINQLTVGDPFTEKQELLSSLQSEAGYQVFLNELSDEPP